MSRTASSARFAVAVLAALVIGPIPVSAIPNYSVVIITELPFETYAWAVNIQGTVGGLTTYNGSYVGYTRSAIGEFDQFNMVSMIRGINNADHVVGHSLHIDINTGGQQGIPGVSDYYVDAWALDINDNDVVVGYAQALHNEEGLTQVGFVWDPVNGTRAAAVPGLTELVSVNNANIAVGNIRPSTGSSGATVYDINTGAYTNLNDLLVPGGPQWSEAAYINNQGVVVGEGWNGSFTAAFTWTPASGFTFLPGLKGGETGRVHPTGISDDGVVVGYALTGDWKWRAFMWTEADGMQDLNDLVPDLGSTILDRALRVSDNGIIVGDSHTGPNFGPYSPFILTPQPTTSSAGGTPAVRVSAQAFPNPFNPQTTLRLTVPSAGVVRVDIYRTTGGHVITLLDGVVGAGTSTVTWNGRDADGRAVGSGVYVVRLSTPESVVSEKLTLLK